MTGAFLIGDSSVSARVSKRAWVNGAVVPLEDAAPSVASITLHTGTGVFDGIMAYWNEDHFHLFRAEDHFRRFVEVCDKMGLSSPWDMESLLAGARSLLETCTPTTQYLRPLAYRPEPEIMLVSQYRSFASVCMFAVEVERSIGSVLSCSVSSIRRVSRAAIPISWKVTGIYANSYLAQRDALARGFDIALLLDDEDRVTEASTANIFFIKGGRLITPPLSRDVFPGITRKIVLEIAADLSVAVAERDVYPRDFPLFDGAVVTRRETLFSNGYASASTQVREDDL
jgi:branched-chain amino acid aminotransferase